MRAALTSFVKDESGLTAIECVAILAILFPLTFAFAEIQRYNRFARHMWAAAESLATLVATRTTVLSGPALTQDSASIADVLAEAAAPLAANWREGVGVQATLVRFAPEPAGCTTGCAYPIGSIVWTWSGGAAGSRALLQAAGVLRACGALAPTTDTRPRAGALAAEAFGLQSRIVIDLVYPFKPMLVSDVLGPRAMVWQSHQAPKADLSNVLSLSDEVTACP